MTKPAYRGRFAPSPTGELHFGTLLAAVGSYLQARNRHGEWLLRIEDVDVTRRIPGAADALLSALEGFGFEWDGEIVYQSRRTELYESALAVLAEKGLIYPCTCRCCSMPTVTSSANPPGQPHWIYHNRFYSYIQHLNC